MDVTTPTATTTPAAPALALPSAEESSVLSSDFETFIKMLTTQAKYQDPLEPIDSSEYAAQLAQFSMVEQQVKSNDILAQLVTQMGGSNLTGMASWIGMEARTTTPPHFDGAPISVTPTLPTGADEMYLNVYDSAGAQVQRLALPLSTDPYQWTGLNDNGSPFETGTYRMEIEAYGNEELLSTTAAQTYSKITEVQSGSGDAALVLASGHSISAAEISALRAAN